MPHEQIVPKAAAPHARRIRLMTIWFGANDACLLPSPQHVRFPRRRLRPVHRARRLTLASPALTQLPIPRFKENLKSMIDHVQRYSPHTALVLITPPPIHGPTRAGLLAPRPLDRDQETTRAYARAVLDVGAAEDVETVDLFAAVERALGGDLERGAEVLRDGLHLNKAGYQARPWDPLSSLLGSQPDDRDVAPPPRRSSTTRSSRRSARASRRSTRTPCRPSSRCGPTSTGLTSRAASCRGRGTSCERARGGRWKGYPMDQALPDWAGRVRDLSRRGGASVRAKRSGPCAVVRPRKTAEGTAVPPSLLTTTSPPLPPTMPARRNRPKKPHAKASPPTSETSTSSTLNVEQDERRQAGGRTGSRCSRSKAARRCKRPCKCDRSDTPCALAPTEPLLATDGCAQSALARELAGREQASGLEGKRHGYRVQEGGATVGGATGGASCAKRRGKGALEVSFNTSKGGDKGQGDGEDVGRCGRGSES